jgi:anthranilate synthase component 1
MIYHCSVLADFLTPVSAFLRVASGSDRAFLLESVEGGEKVGRYSFIGVDPVDRYEGSYEGFRRFFPEIDVPHPDLPPFSGGAVGVFSYDMVRELEKLPNLIPADPLMAAVQMDLFTTVLAFDHVKHQIIIMSHEGRRKVAEIEERLGEVSAQETHILRRYNSTGIANRESPDLAGQGGASLSAPRCNFTPSAFHSAVEKAKDYIRAGDIFQVVLSQSFDADYFADPFSVYRALRYINPSPYMFFLKRGDDSIAGSSPEMLIRVQGRDLDYRPIAGTRRRGRTLLEERELEEELRCDEKEMAEHLMLVDLGRNDLGRVSEYGNVSVEKFMFLEKYSHVMHLVSALKGRLRPELDRFDALAACFPAGTVTGAPKIRAMEIIEELEPSRRGVYAGSIGYVDYSGNLDTCITIRTIHMKKGKAYFQAGAGIVADSIPEREDLECRNKAMVLIHALELAEQL